MKNAPIQNGIYAITHNGQTAHYATETFGNPQDVLLLLHRVHEAVAAHPDSPLSDVDRLLQYSHNMVPISVSERMRLFQPLEQGEFDFVLDEIKGGGGGTAYYELDYDRDRFAVTSWDGDELKTASAWLQDMFDACGKSIRRSGCSGTWTHLNTKALTASLAEIMTIRPTSTDPGETEQANEAPDCQGRENLWGPSDFTGPPI